MIEPMIGIAHLREAADLQHRIIEAAKAAFREPGNTYVFEDLLAIHAKALSPAHLRATVSTKNGVWNLTVVKR